MYTSGSTGLPKGALIRHDGALNHMFAEFRLLHFHMENAFLQSAPVSSDISVWQCLGPLLVGGRVVFADYETMCSPPVLLSLIRHERTTLIELVPTVLEALIDHASGLPETDRALPDLEYAMVTGESASVALANRWFALWPDVPLVNAYGPTEAADDICQHVMRGPLDANETHVPIGTPIDNLSVLVLDQRCELVPVGVRGEICVAGIGVGPGYWQQPDRTAAAFVDNPHADRTFGATLYRTGDIGRWRNDGRLEFLGRADHQVKIRGFRVELGEVEAALTRRTDVREAIVVDHLDQRNERQLVAYVQAGAGAIDQPSLASEQLRLWQDLHDDSYGETTLLERDPTFNIVGWESTYTGELLSTAEMEECVDNAVSRISLSGRGALSKSAAEPDCCSTGWCRIVSAMSGPTFRRAQSGSCAQAKPDWTFPVSTGLNCVCSAQTTLPASRRKASTRSCSIRSCSTSRTSTISSTSSRRRWSVASAAARSSSVTCAACRSCAAIMPPFNSTRLTTRSREANSCGALKPSSRASRSLPLRRLSSSRWCGISRA